MTVLAFSQQLLLTIDEIISLLDESALGSDHPFVTAASFLRRYFFLAKSFSLPRLKCKQSILSFSFPNGRHTSPSEDDATTQWLFIDRWHFGAAFHVAKYH